MDTAKTYDKANSILELRQHHGAREDAARRVEEVAARLGSRTDDRATVVRQACQDLLGRATDEPRFQLRPHVVEELRRLRDEELERYVYYRYRYDMYPVLKRLDDFPPCLQIEPASICNYRCVFCYQVDTAFTTPKNGHMGLMSLDLFKQVVDQAEGRCEAVTLASRGEPLIAPKIDAMLNYMTGKFLAAKLNTNAWYLDERKAHAVLQADLNTVVFSADAAAEPLYSQLRVNGKLDRVVENVARFRDIRARDYPQSRVITRVSGVRYSSDQSFEEMNRFWGELVDQVAFVDYNPWENSYERPFTGVESPCTDLWRRMFVWWDGIVNPCDVDYRSTLAVGRLEAPLSDLWRGEAYTRLRDAHLNQQRGQVGPCNRCSVV